ncbi:MAG: peptidoglycan-associated lipoprotein Pal [Alphaproteobacteria bacterium]|nr:peptidoglycan-associated lipoprotein Pal [Alphaproteobacteria bacterium]
MFARYFLLFGVILLVGACSSNSNKGDVDAGFDNGLNDGDGVFVQEDDVYGDENAPAPGTQADLVVNVGDRIFFGTDSSDLSSAARTTLENQASWLGQYQNLTVTIEGHADERGTREYNLALGERRANAVRNYLVALGVSQSRISVISYGKERPAVPGSNETAWSQNRRGVTKVQ